MKIIFAILYTISITTVYSQESYDLSLNRELKVYSTIVSIYALSNIISNNSEDSTLKTSANINFFDSSAIKLYSPHRSNTSDIILITSILATGSSLLYRDIESNNLSLSVMYSETIFFTYSLTTLSKSIINRQRPYSYNKNVSNDIKFKDNSINDSFFSGHTSLAFASSIFLSTVYSEIYPNSKYKKYIWIGSISTASTVGYLRYRSGKHFPSDILVGAAVGSLIGWYIPFSHKKEKKVLELSPLILDNGYSLTVNYKF